MATNKKILIGVAVNGTGGIDSYILSFVKATQSCNIQCHVLTTNFDENYNKKLKAYGAKLYRIANLKNRSSIYKTIKELNDKNQYSAAYWNISTALMYPYVKASTKCRIPNIAIHSHAHYNNQSSNIKLFIFDNLHYLYRKKMLNLPVKFAACAKECARWIAGDDIVSKSNWLFVPNPIDTEKCKFNKSIRKKTREELYVEDKNVYGCVTSFSHYKNPLYLIEVFAQIRKKDKSAHLLIAADGEMISQVENLASALLTKDSYTLLGHRTDVYCLLQAFDCFVLPSKNEGLPLCVLEAQAADLPVLMSTNITDEVVVLKDKVKRLPFTEGSAKWATEAIQLTDKFKNRKSSAADKVNDAGFNLESPKIALSILGF